SQKSHQHIHAAQACDRGRGWPGLSSQPRARKQDADAVEIYKANGVEIKNMTPEEFEAWRTIAKETSYKSFLEQVSDGQKLLDMALSVE
ncbi:MAG: hypothetical protein AAFV62_12660, partial [Pseudomonadota bacterium]